MFLKIKKLYLNQNVFVCKWQNSESNQFKQTRNLLAHVTSSFSVASTVGFAIL